MGQLAVVLRDPQKRRTIRAEGGQFEYGDPIPLIEDLIATRRVWDEATLLENDSPAALTYGYLAFWDHVGPTLNFWVSRQAVRSSRPEARQLFESPAGREQVLRFVEIQAKRLGGFETAKRLDGFETDPEPQPEAASSWVRLLADDSFS